MIAFLDGVLAGRLEGYAVIQCGGLGFRVGMSSTSLSELPSIGQPVQVHTYMQVREDGISLFGFSTLEEKALFEKLISVSGVGPKVALAALSSFKSQDLSNAIMAGDAAKLSRIPGVGKKTAQRMILELQGSLEVAYAPVAGGLFDNSGIEKIVIEDLLSMGFTSAEAELACKDLPKGADESRALQYALKRLGEK